MSNISTAKFRVGQLVHHRLFDYRGIVVDVDPNFQGSESWYESMAKTRPPKDHPWYYVLVHDADYNTYVAERNLEEDFSVEDINHPLVQDIFDKKQDGVYIPRRHAH